MTVTFPLIDKPVLKRNYDFYRLSVHWFQIVTLLSVTLVSVTFDKIHKFKKIMQTQFTAEILDHKLKLNVNGPKQEKARNKTQFY